MLLYVENASSLRPSVHLDVMQMQITQIPVAVLLQLELSILYKQQQGQHHRDLNKIQGVVWHKPGPAGTGLLRTLMKSLCRATHCVDCHFQYGYLDIV
jgi:hypothetical protein